MAFVIAMMKNAKGAFGSPANRAHQTNVDTNAG